MTVLHIIINLSSLGGAELMLKRLVENSKRENLYEPKIISLTSAGELGDYLKGIDIEVNELNIKNVFDIPYALIRLIYLIKLIKPDAIQTWMYHADLIGGIAGRLCGIKNIFWNIRNTHIPQSKFSRTGFIIKLCALSSKFIPKKIICCAKSGLINHSQLGYDHKKMIVIPNGFDLKAWPLPGKNTAKIREEYNLPNDAFIIGIVARFDPLKGYENFIEAAGIMAENYDQPLLFLMAGRNINKSNDKLLSLIKRKGGKAVFKLLGERNDILKIMYLLDLYCLSSKAEGFPNVVAESMLMQTPCVVTDVGDAKIIVDSLGKVVPAGDPKQLANALTEMALLNKIKLQDLGLKSRERIVQHYDLNKVARKYFKQYEV